MFIDFTAANKILTVSHLTQHDFQITKQNQTKNYYKCFCYRCSTQTQMRIKRSSHQVSSPTPVIKSKQRSNSPTVAPTINDSLRHW